MADRPFGFRTHPSVTSTALPLVVFDVIVILRNHLIWSGDRAESDEFKMLTFEAPPGPATVGTTFTSSGSAGKDTFHDHSVVIEVAPPRTFVIQTDARLERRNAKTWRRTSGIATTCSRKVPASWTSCTPRPSNA